VTDPVNTYTMGGIVKDAGLSISKFRKLLGRKSLS